MRRPGLPIVLSAALWLAAAGLVQAGEARSRLEPRECWFDSAQVSGAECAALFVPERWDRAESGKNAKLLRLRVVRFRAAGDRETAAPIVYLAAGPGWSAVPEGIGRARAWRRFADRLKTGRDVILFDQRGTGRAYPRLDCPESVEPRVWGGLSESKDGAGSGAAAEREALEACLDRYRQLGRDLEAFTSRQSAADVEALRQAFGYDQIALYGQAYGTTLALTVMAAYPESVAAALLDSLLPPQVADGLGNPRTFAAVLERLFAACDRHGSCGRAYPDLRERFTRTLARLYVEPVILEIQNLQGTAPLYAKIDDVTLLNIIFFEMFERPGLQTLPMMIAGFAKGEHWRLRSHAENYFYDSSLPHLARGMTLSVACREQFALTSRPDSRAGAADWPFLVNWATRLREESPCHYWPVTPMAPDPQGVAVSPIPTLLLAGAFDPVAPLELAQQAAQSLPNSHLFVIPNGGHTVSSDGGCAAELVFEFLANPDERPDPDCLKDLPPPAFTVLGAN